jgi:hypothetical protein
MRNAPVIDRMRYHNTAGKSDRLSTLMYRLLLATLLAAGCTKGGPTDGTDYTTDRRYKDTTGLMPIRDEVLGYWVQILDPDAFNPARTQVDIRVVGGCARQWRVTARQEEATVGMLVALNANSGTARLAPDRWYQLQVPELRLALRLDGEDSTGATVVTFDTQPIDFTSSRRDTLVFRCP